MRSERSCAHGACRGGFGSGPRGMRWGGRCFRSPGPFDSVCIGGIYPLTGISQRFISGLASHPCPSSPSPSPSPPPQTQPRPTSWGHAGRGPGPGRAGPAQSNGPHGPSGARRRPFPASPTDASTAPEPGRRAARQQQGSSNQAQRLVRSCPQGALPILPPPPLAPDAPPHPLLVRPPP